MTCVRVGPVEELLLPGFVADGIWILEMPMVSRVNRPRIVPGATHLFQEPGTLETVGRLARDWLTRSVPTARDTIPLC